MAKRKTSLDKEAIKERMWKLLCDVMHQEGTDVSFEDLKRFRIGSNVTNGFDAVVFGDRNMRTAEMKRLFRETFPPPPPEVIRLDVPMTLSDKRKIRDHVTNSCLNKAAKDAILAALNG